jgi:uncharacterized protein YgbK (DUF1537 family)
LIFFSLAELLIIADDLTGAIDTGVQLAKQGIRTQVILEPDSDYQLIFQENSFPVLVVNTESRHIDELEAAYRIREIMKAAKTAGIKRYFKKTDSTLRGNIGKELEAFKNSIDQKFLPFIPAHPKLKRYTRNGHHFIGDTLLHETVFGNDPLEPVAESHIAHLLGQQTRLKIGELNLKNDSQIPPVDILVFDCESVEDLQPIAAYLFENNCDQAIAGSAAMVELLPDILELKKEAPITPRLESPALLINGSLNEISRQQIKFAAVAGINNYSIPEQYLVAHDLSGGTILTDLVPEIRNTFENGQNFLLSTSSVGNPEVHPFSSKGRKYKLIAQNTGLIVKYILENISIAGLIVFGGDTLMGIMQALKGKSIEPLLEIEPGVALSFTIINEQKLYVITKPGGYGDEDVIIKIFNYIKSKGK